ncbi:hypothetical protein DMB92_00890 [Campylobacter sp. MIT 99-7217]|uniref:hypothetical protein n=1 Tax=Campylobacter sp. MIT 99-7217 TaxID=535091 RepID=UPI00115994B5|nr:hypothetical protein [Campylobacter sp. MIT 99-7217]TQR34553.1 hypothetical protein DMB92_00890 [Campylobacter sp. MIT 99-7217]
MNEKILNLLVVSILGILVSACVSNHSINYTKEQTDQYAFNVENEDVLANPPENKSRIYIYRGGSIMGLAIKYAVSVGLDDENLGNFFSSSRNNYAHIDLESSNAKQAYLFARSESETRINFFPQINKIYCFESSVAQGWLQGRAKIELVDKETCLKAIQDIKN